MSIAACSCYAQWKSLGTCEETCVVCDSAPEEKKLLRALPCMAYLMPAPFYHKTEARKEATQPTAEVLVL